MEWLRAHALRPREKGWSDAGSAPVIKILEIGVRAFEEHLE